MKKIRKELLQGTLDLLILKVLATDKLHGWDISKRIQIVSSERLILKQGSLYPALHRLENRGWIEAEWGVSEAGRSAKFYSLTDKGRLQLQEEKQDWTSFIEAMEAVLSLKEFI
ncbi:MAG: PadR family transcriptional regulator [Opitutales bacterium]|nr:PadR family transcriptional regulator [Opitutales bacterium]